MPHVIEYAPFYLKKDVLVEEFLQVSDRFEAEFMSQQKGYISRTLSSGSEIWADIVLWESMEDAQNAVRAFKGNAAACAYLSFMDEGESSCEMRHFTVEKSY